MSWRMKENENIRYEDIDIRRNSLSKYAYDVAILGKHISITAKELRPELITDGMFSKVWKREDDVLELWKTDITSSFVNTRAEIKASYILDHSNVNHVRYEKRMQGDILFAVSKCVSNEHLSHINAQGVYDWCKHTGVDFLVYVEERFPEDFHRMIFADYCLANTDRHFGNWWFQVDADTNQIIGLGALMDHNQALIADMFGTDIRDLVYEPTGLTFEETARKYAKYAGEIDIDTDVLPEACRRRYNHIKDLGNIQTQEKEKVRNRGGILCFDKVEENGAGRSKRASEPSQSLVQCSGEEDIFDVLNEGDSGNLGMDESRGSEIVVAEILEVPEEGIGQEST